MIGETALRTKEVNEIQSDFPCFKGGKNDETEMKLTWIH